MKKIISLCIGILSLTAFSATVQEQKLYERQFQFDLNLNDIYCKYSEGRPGTFEPPFRHIFFIDPKAFHQEELPDLDNTHLSQLNRKIRIDLVDYFGKPIPNLPFNDCSVLGELWSKSSSGHTPVNVLHTVSRRARVTWNQKCSQEVLSTKSFELLGQRFSISRGVVEHIRNVSPNKCQIVGLVPQGQIHMHIRAASQFGVHCESFYGQSELKFQLEIVSREFAHTILASDQKFESLQACNEARKKLFDIDRQTDPKNSGRVYRTHKRVETVLRESPSTPGPLPKLKSLKYTLKTRIHNIPFTGTLFLNIQYMDE